MNLDVAREPADERHCETPSVPPRPTSDGPRGRGVMEGVPKGRKRGKGLRRRGTPRGRDPSALGSPSSPARDDRRRGEVLEQT